MHETVLIVDDDKAVLEFAAEALHEKGCHVVIMDDPVAALEFLEKEEVAVLVSDNNMPVMCGLELVTKAKEVSPDTVSIIMTAYTDLSVVLCAINQCQAFKFLPKPWKQRELLSSVRDALRRFRTLQTIQRENEDVLHSLAQTIELKDACTRGHCDRVATFAVRIAKDLGLPMDMQREIKYGSWLHDCGKIGVPEDLLNAKHNLSAEEYALIKHHSMWGADVACKANLSKVVINIVMYHHEHFDGNGYPFGLKGKQIPVESRIVSVADVFDALSSDRPYRSGFPRPKIIEMLGAMKGKQLDPSLVDLFVNNCLVEKTP